MRIKRLPFALAATAATFGSFATEFTLDGLRYSVSDYDHATLLGRDDPGMLTIFIPCTINYAINGEEYMFFVTEVAADAFAGTDITGVTFCPPSYSGSTSKGNLVIDDGAFDTPTLRSVNTFRPDLPEVKGDPFNAETYAEGTLGFGINLTQDQIDAYKAVEPWSRFNRSETTDIQAPPAYAPTSRVEVYTPAGLLVYSGDPREAALPAGLYVVRSGSDASKIRL